MLATLVGRSAHGKRVNESFFGCDPIIFLLPPYRSTPIRSAGAAYSVRWGNGNDQARPRVVQRQSPTPNRPCPHRKKNRALLRRGGWRKGPACDILSVKKS